MHRETLNALIPRMLGAAGGPEAPQGRRLMGVKPQHVHAIMQDRSSSHLVEVRARPYHW